MSCSIFFTFPALYLVPQSQKTTPLLYFKCPNLQMSNPCQGSYFFSVVNSPQMPPGMWMSAVKTHCYSGIPKLTRDNRCSLKNTRIILSTWLINWQFKMVLFSISISLCSYAFLIEPLLHLRFSSWARNLKDLLSLTSFNKFSPDVLTQNCGDFYSTQQSSFE